jgi:tetratricopeptide (TPR) repeat protein
MLARLIQQKVPLGSQVRFSLKNGREISGILVEIGRDHITVETKTGPALILTEMIGLWEILEEEIAKPEQEVEEKPVAKEEKWGNQSAEIPREQVLPSSDLQLEGFKKLAEIEGHFQARLQNAKIELKAPNFEAPSDEIRDWQKLDAARVWNRIKDRYEYAQKINELSARFGRIQPMASDLKRLMERFPASSGLKRHLAYLYSLLGNHQEAIQCYQDAVISSGKAEMTGSI